MKNKAVLYVLTVIFALTVAAGILSPQEAEKILEQSATVILEEETIEDVPLPVEPEPVADDKHLYPVVRVIDGDTIVIKKNDTDETVRLIGIDTPETVHPKKPVQCFGAEASKKTKEWLEGESVYVEIDEQEGERDKYGRMLGYVFRPDDFFVNLELIRQGYAFEYTYDLPYKYQKEFQAAEREAQTKENGLWDEGVCLGTNE